MSGYIIIGRDTCGNYTIRGCVYGITDGETRTTTYIFYSKRDAIRKWCIDNGAIHKRIYVYDNTKN